MHDSFALKLDMRKAYDRVHWGFLQQALLGFGITGRNNELIMNCVTTVSFSVLLNGRPQGLFLGERGIRQECPLSPYLFIIRSQALSSINIMERNGLYSGYRLNKWASSVRHIMFADDIMLRGAVNDNTLESISTILQQYHMVSGQMVNYTKSSIYLSKNVTDEKQEEVIARLGVVRVRDDEKYLRVKILQQ